MDRLAISKELHDLYKNAELTVGLGTTSEEIFRILKNKGIEAIPEDPRVQAILTKVLAWTKEKNLGYALTLIRNERFDQLEELTPWYHDSGNKKVAYWGNEARASTQVKEFLLNPKGYWMNQDGEPVTLVELDVR